MNTPTVTDGSTAVPFLFNPATASDGFTQSEMSTLANCPRKWYWQYNHRLQRQGGYSWPLLIGSVIHAALEQMYRSRGADWSCDDIVLPDGAILDADGEGKKKYYEAVNRVVTKAYYHFYKPDFESLHYVGSDVEVDAKVEFEGLIFRAKLDLVFSTSSKHPQDIWVMDHKSSGRIGPDTIAGWEFRFQFLFYAWMLWKLRPQFNVRGYVINAIKKPQLRIKKNEAVEEFVTRVYNDMLFDRPEQYFYRDRLILTKGELQRFEDDVLRHKINKIKTIMDPAAPLEVRSLLALDMNTDHCTPFAGSTCQFMPLCKEGYTANSYQYRQKAVKHAELVEGDDTPDE